MGLDMKEEAVRACRLTNTAVKGHNVTIVELLLLDKGRPTLG